MNFGLEHFEYQYINVKKLFFAEKYLCDDIKDYKIYCYNGEPKFIDFLYLFINNIYSE
jgi:hypothetical protein